VVGEVKGQRERCERTEKVLKRYEGKWNFDYDRGMVWQIY